ncbi:aquaporin-11 [Erinaceus europaeus]|uniref:Aquaporin-11 n=1 Tax=Erinaceus europaeus TaxID=9365 RepID=A0A1S3A5P0_ERIEU|nr:aquaporin-11 [Erinaceus europaeus]
MRCVPSHRPPQPRRRRGREPKGGLTVGPSSGAQQPLRASIAAPSPAAAPTPERRVGEGEAPRRPAPGREEGGSRTWDSEKLAAARRRERGAMAQRGLWPEVQDTCTSLGLLLAAVLLAGAARVLARKQLQRPLVHAFVLELLATWQLCCCTHELQLLGEQELLHPTWPLILVYFFSLLHGLTLVGTASNPCSVLMQMLLGGMSAEMGAARLLAQLLGALGGRFCMGALWGLGLTKYHDGGRSFVCRNPIQVDLSKAVIAEALCSFIFHSALLHFQEVRTKLRIHLLAALITFLVYAGGSLTGAVFNPALALSLHFQCFDEEFIRFFIVYWLAPSLGILLMILMFSFFLPWLYNNRTSSKKE